MVRRDNGLDVRKRIALRAVVAGLISFSSILYTGFKTSFDTRFNTYYFFILTLMKRRSAYPIILPQKNLLRKTKSTRIQRLSRHEFSLSYRLIDLGLNKIWYFLLGVWQNIRRIFLLPSYWTLSPSNFLSHFFITGGTGVGKSEVFKWLIEVSSKDENSSIVVSDPHGSLVKNLTLKAEWLNKERIVYVHPHFDSGYQVIINPFEIKDKSESSLEVQSANLNAAFEEILGGFSINMASLLLPCITVLLHRPDSDFSDLARFMDSEQNDDLVRYGREKLLYSEHQHFFTHRFYSPLYKSTKEALLNRFQALLNIPTIKNFLCGSSTLDLEELLEAKKIILCNFSITGCARQVPKVFGQLITAMIQSYAMRRHRQKISGHAPIFFFADECQYMISRATEEILGESRKYGLFLRLATQRTEQIGEKVLDAILGNSGLFLVGRNRGKTLARMTKELELCADDVRGLKTGEFFVVQSGKLPIKVKMPSTRSHRKISKEDYQVFKAQQLKNYYQKTPKAKKHLDLKNNTYHQQQRNLNNSSIKFPRFLS